MLWPLSLSPSRCRLRLSSSSLVGSTTSSSLGSSVCLASASTTTTAARPRPPPAVNELRRRRAPARRASSRPLTAARCAQLGTLVKSSANLGAGDRDVHAGHAALAFALNASSGGFIYAPTALYIAKSPDEPAIGPFLAPADPMAVAPQYRSKQNAGPGGIKAIYSTQVPLPQAGTYTILSLTRTPHGLIGAPGEIAVAASSPIPTSASARRTSPPTRWRRRHGSIALLTTRIPPESMHSVSFNQVLGKKPIALLFSTPQLCISRVCGPVTDIAVQLQHTFGNRITFIHEEVYVDNQPAKGLRPQLKAFHLQTEPWLFTINRQGMIAARLEGAFGITRATQALQAALQ